MTWSKMVGAMLCASITLGVVAARAAAQALLVTAEGSAGLALTTPQADRFGAGGAIAAGGYLATSPWLLLGGRLRAGLLSNGEAPADVGLKDPGIGSFETLSATARLRPLEASTQGWYARGLFIEGGVGGTVTGQLVRPSFEAGVGFGVALGDFSLAPTLRYLQVLQPSDPLSDEDARVLMLGAEFALIDAAPVQASTQKEETPPPIPKDIDEDGILDGNDKCPSTPEDRDSFEDADGCPELDNDRDKILDASDRCPNAAEDIDLFEDEDGCPDPDNDQDTFADADDQCPLEAEVINGNKDYDGCPDEGVIEMRNDRIVLEEQVLFDFERARVKSAGRPVLDAIVSLYKQHPEWIKIRIEGHADPRGDEAFNQELSQRRAENVRKELVELGIPEALIEAVGFGASKPRDLRSEEKAYQRNRRVEFVVVASSAAVPEPKP